MTVGAARFTVSRSIPPRGRLTRPSARCVPVTRSIVRRGGAARGARQRVARPGTGRRPRARLHRALPRPLPRRRRGEGAHRALDGARRGRARPAARAAGDGRDRRERAPEPGGRELPRLLRHARVAEQRRVPRLPAQPGPTGQVVPRHGAAVRQRRVAEGRPTPRRTRASGNWIADVERPAPENRSGYQPHLDEARPLVAGKCAAPVQRRHDPAAPRCPDRPRQHPLTTGGIVVRSAAPTTTAWPARRRRSVSAPSAWRHASPRPAASPHSSRRVPRETRRDIRAGRSVRARVTAFAADTSSNTTRRRRLVTLSAPGDGQGHRPPERRRPVRLQPRASPARARAAGSAAPPRRRREPHPAVRGGRPGPRARRRTPTRCAA